MHRKKRRRHKNRMLRKIRNTFIFLAARFVFAVARLIPLGIGLRLGPLIGRAAFFVDRPDRRKALRHLRTAFPDKDKAWRIDVGRRSFMNLGRSFFELFHFDEILKSIEGKGRHPDYIRIEGAENLEASRARGKGALMVTGHCGNWELLAASTARQGYSGSTIVRQLYDPRIDTLLNNHRKQFGYHPIMRQGIEAAREMLRILRRNEIVGILIDQDTKVRGVFVPFFGHLAHTASGPALIAIKTDATVIPAFIHRRTEGGHVITYHRPIPRPQTDDVDADVREYTAMLTKAIEDHIRQHPDEWVWMHRRWKKRPEGEPREENPVPPQ